MVRLWRQMAMGLGHKWVSQFGQAVKTVGGKPTNELTATARHWLMALRGVPMSQLAQAIERAQQMPDAWWPTLGGFLELCKPSYEALGIPEPARAYMMAVMADWSAPIVWFAVREVGSFELRNRPEYQARKAFEQAYAGLVQQAEAGRVFVIPASTVPQIEHVPAVLVDVMGGPAAHLEKMLELLCKRGGQVMAGIQGDVLELVRRRLNEWGQWQNDLPHAVARGYAAKANFVQGCGGGDAVIVNQAAEEVEKILTHLKCHSPEVVNVLHQHYAQRAANEIGAARCRMSVATFKKYRDRGEYYVMARLEVGGEVSRGGK